MRTRRALLRLTLARQTEVPFIPVEEDTRCHLSI